MIAFSQVGFPTINRRPLPDPVPMFVRYPRHRMRSVPSAAICATGRNSRNGLRSGEKLAFTPSAAIRAGTLKKTK
jgi:hypothetical protein